MQIRSRLARIVVGIVLIALIGAASLYVVILVAADRQHALARQALERYDFRQAADHLEKALWWRAGDPDVQMLAAQTARRRGNIDEMERHLRLAVKAGAPSQVLDTERNLLTIQLGDMNDAPRLVQLCDQNPAGPEAALGFEVIFEGSMKSFQLGLARHAIDSWLQHRPGKFDQAHALVWRGRLHQYFDEWPQAIADYHRALELDPDHADAHIALANALIRDDSRKAVPHVEWLSRRYPSDVDVRLLSVRLRRTLGQPEEAERLAESLLKTAPDHVQGLIERGRIAMDLGKPRDGEPFLRHAVTQAPNVREGYLALSDCLRQMGQVDEAKRYQDHAKAIEDFLQKKLDEISKGKGKG
jgi:tetratricopeptide (TPR) repeat protein